MTQFLVDIASYQHDRADPLNLAVVQQKGFSLVNIKTTQGTHYTFAAGRLYADKARSLGMGICTFHYLTDEASGSAQADFAWKQILNLGGPQGIAHECDCETNATQAIYRDYVKAMQDKLGRHVMTYSGDWWWKPRGWTGADLTPYYTAAPNAGYLGSYPGDGSPHWHAGYGGWDSLSMMQYAVSAITGAGGGNLSKSAIRDPAVWSALTGGDDMSVWDVVIGTAQTNPLKFTAGEILLGTNKAAFQGSGTVTQLVELVKAIGAKVDIDPAELDAIAAAAKQGAMEGVEAGAAQLVAAITAALKGVTGLTEQEAEAAAEAAVRKVLGAVDGATAQG
jgi:hypothetical protein